MCVHVCIQFRLKSQLSWETHLGILDKPLTINLPSSQVCCHAEVQGSLARNFCSRCPKEQSAVQLAASGYPNACLEALLAVLRQNKEQVNMQSCRFQNQTGLPPSDLQALGAKERLKIASGTAAAMQRPYLRMELFNPPGLKQTDPNFVVVV